MRALPLACLLTTSAAWGEALPATAPPLVGGIADPSGATIFVAGESGGLDAVDLATGKRRWTTRDADRPLLAVGNRLLVTAVNPKQAGRLALRVLDTAGGLFVADVGPVLPPAGSTVVVWAPMSRQGAGPWRVAWAWRDPHVYGIRPPDPLARESGVIRIDPASWHSEAGPPESPPGPPALPPSFAPDPQRIYWSWSEYGSSWTTRPRAFAIGGGVMGVLARATSGERRLEVIRWRPGEPLPPLTIERGGEDRYPIVAEGGRYLVLTGNTVTVHDLVRPDATPVPLPPFPTGFVAQIAIVGPRLYYVVMRTSPHGGGGMRIDRDLVAIDWMLGKERWRYRLRPEIQAPPVPGARP